MANRERGRSGRAWWWISILVIAILAILAWYFLGTEQGRRKTEKPTAVERVPSAKKEPAPEKKPEGTGVKGPVVSQEIVQQKPESKEDYCKRVEKDVRDFFNYLNTRDYVRHIEEGTDSFDHFKKILGRLSAKLPVPAGEGVDSALINENVFYLFRVLEKKDLRLIREIIANESDTLEMNLDIFYRWISLGNRCPDPEGVRPSQEVLYHYAGFFLNTIGGRAYLFRRPLRLRLLGTYYSLLIVHEADKEGRNLYGIDPLPYIAPLVKEIQLYPDLRFRETYLAKLESLDKYYAQRR
jgi:hypothetical protein